MLAITPRTLLLAVMSVLAVLHAVTAGHISTTSNPSTPVKDRPSSDVASPSDKLPAVPFDLATPFITEELDTYRRKLLTLRSRTPSQQRHLKDLTERAVVEKFRLAVVKTVNERVSNDALERLQRELDAFIDDGSISLKYQRALYTCKVLLTPKFTTTDAVVLDRMESLDASGRMPIAAKESFARLRRKRMMYTAKTMYLKRAQEDQERSRGMQSPQRD